MEWITTEKYNFLFELSLDLSVSYCVLQGKFHCCIVAGNVPNFVTPLHPILQLFTMDWGFIQV
jgi:hypothetical protein